MVDGGAWQGCIWFVNNFFRASSSSFVHGSAAKDAPPLEPQRKVTQSASAMCICFAG